MHYAFLQGGVEFSLCRRKKGYLMFDWFKKKNDRRAESNGPNLNDITPIPAIKRIVFIKNFTNDPKIVAGDYSYFDNEEGFDA